MRAVSTLTILLIFPLISRAQSTLKFDYNVENRELSEVLTELSVPLPFAVRGTINVSAKVEVPRFSVFDRNAYRVDGTATMTKLDISGIVVENIEAKYTYRNGIFVCDITSPRIRFRGQDALRLDTRIVYSAQGVRYSGNVDWLGGHVHLNGFYPLQKLPIYPASQPLSLIASAAMPFALPNQEQGRFTIDGVQLARVRLAFGMLDFLRQLDGLAEFDFRFRHRPGDGWPVGRGRLIIDSVRWAERTVSTGVGCDFSVIGEEIWGDNLIANFGDGSISGDFLFDLLSPNRRRMVLELRRVPVSRLLLPLPGLAPFIEVPVSGRIESSIGSQMRGSAVLTLLRGQFFRLPLSEMRVPVTWDVRLNPLQGTLTFRDVTGQIGLGRMSGEGSLIFSYGGPTRLKGHIKFVNVNANTLINSLSNNGATSGGQATGVLDFSSDNLQTLADVNGSIRAELGQLQLFQMPLFEQIARFLAPVRSLNTPGRKGELQATLNRGVIRIRRFTFVASSVQMYVEGTMTLDGRLNLDVLANTGRLFINSGFVRLAALVLGVGVGPVPLVVILEASRFLSDRTVQLSVTGTLTQPYVRIRPLVTLTEEAVRFFLDRANLPVP